MSETGDSLCILGRQPEFGRAELESLYGSRLLRANHWAAILSLPAQEISFQRLGGTQKVAKVLAHLPTTTWGDIEKYMLDNVPSRIDTDQGGKFTLGLSAYGFNVSPSQVQGLALKIKKKTTHPMRIVPNQAIGLNSASVLHNKLTSRGAWELLLVRDGKSTILGQTMFVQDIEAYAARDQVRPARDARVGMLPPKLAQILINLASGQVSPPGRTVLDPFCGTGVVLQEALLMGYDVIGTDIESRMVDYSQKNLDWLTTNYKLQTTNYKLKVADATNHRWPPFNAIATEAYLGRPLTSLPARTELQTIIQDVNTITKKFLKDLQPQLKPGSLAAIALPAWYLGGNRFAHLPIIDDLTDMGYNVADFKHLGSKPLIYHRPGQVVAREVIVIKKRILDE